ncbi:MAG: YolD-like family protein [Eubacterium sp.]|nr:YolD-like family protein [Eubacterium sp.]
MARDNGQIKVDSAHPFIKFDNVLHTYVDTETSQERTVVIGHSPIIQGLNDDILITGDLNTLQNFMQENEGKLNDQEKAYMKARIESAEKVDSLRKKAYSDIAEGKQTQGPEIDEAGGYIGFSELRSPGVQSSGNGCWSVAYSILLKSRGVDLSQEHIRGWRPDQTKNPVEKNQQNERNRNSLMYRMNTDGVNTISQNSDLMTQVIPNTEMRTVKISEPPIESSIKVDGKAPNRQDFEKIKENYIEQSTRFFENIVTKAIKEDHSPIAITYHGHYMTITGISPDGKRIRCEDSFGSKPEDRTREYYIKDIVNDSMSARVLENGENLPPTGYELTWLHDLKVPEYEKKNEQKPDIEAVQERFVTLDDDGNITVDVPVTAKTASNNGNVSEGQLEGKGVEISVIMDMKELSNALGGKQVADAIDSDRPYNMGHYDTYLPKKLYYGKDPQLQQYRQSNVGMQSGSGQPIVTQSTVTQSTTTQPTAIAINPDFYATVRKLNRMAYEQKRTNFNTGTINKNPIMSAMFMTDYKNLKTHIKNNQVLLSSMQPNWEQDFDAKFMENPEDFIYDITSEFSNRFNIPKTQNRDYDSQFVSSYFRLKGKIENAEKAKQTPQVADKYINQDVSRLLNHISNDAYLLKEFYGDYQIYNQSYSPNPIISTKGFLNSIEEKLELSKYYDINGNKLQNPDLTQKEIEFQNSLKVQSQQTETLPNQQHQFDPEFISVLISLKDKVQFVTEEKMLKNSAAARLEGDFEVLIQQIKKDPYISNSFNSQNWENELKIGFQNDPAPFTNRVIENLSNNLGLNAQLQQSVMDQPTTTPTANPKLKRININDVDNQIEQRWRFMRDNINKSGTLTAPGRKNMLAEIVALSEIGARKRAKGNEKPTASPEEVADFTKQIKKNEAFNRLIANGNDLNIIKSQDTKKLLKGLVRTIWDIEDERRYDISDKKNLVQKRCKFLSNKLEATATGSSKKRGRNDIEYTNALNTIKELSEKDNPNTHDVKSAVDAVKEYLADKMTQKGSTLDRERWGHFMLFLKETMPRKDFEKYCHDINRARGVEGKTNSKRYVSPEMFGYKKEPVESMLAETRHRIQSGKGTDRDYAFAIAIRNRFNNVGFLDNGKTLENEVDRQRIVKDTEKILKSENFRRFMTEISEERRRTMLNGDADDLYRFQNMLEPVAQRSSTIAEPQNDNNSIRRKNTQRSHNSSVSSSLGK